MKKGAEVFHKGVRWTVGRDSELSFWNDSWTKFGPLWQVIQGPMTRAPLDLKVRDVVSDGGWDWNKIPFELPMVTKLELQAVPVAMASRGGDKLTWTDCDHSMFNIGSAYKIATKVEHVNHFGGSLIWKVQVLPKIQTFIWLCLHNSIGVRDCLCSRGITDDNSCPLCHSSNESILHALRDCIVVKPIWLQLGAQNIDSLFFDRGINEWLKVNGTNKLTSDQLHIPWCGLFLMAIWLLWKRRNQMVFRNQGPNPHLAKEIIQRAFEYAFCATPTKVPMRRVVTHVRWSKPNAGWMKLNTDGSSLGNPGLAKGGGLIRNEEGRWVVGFARKIGITSSFLAELWAFRDGLSLCVSRGFAAVEVELDAKSIMDAISNPEYSNIFASSLMDDCRHMVKQVPRIRFKHCFREANRCVDALARMGGFLDVDFTVFESPPVDISSFLDFDCNGLFLSRLCPAPLFST